MHLELNSDLQPALACVSVWRAIKRDSRRCSIRCNYRRPSYFCHLKMEAGSRVLNYGEAAFSPEMWLKVIFQAPYLSALYAQRGQAYFHERFFFLMCWWADIEQAHLAVQSTSSSGQCNVFWKQPSADELMAVISAPGEAGLKALHNTSIYLPPVSALRLNHRGGIFLASSRWSVWSFSVGENGRLRPIKLCSWHSYQGDRENTSHRSYFSSQNSNIKEQFDRCMMVWCDMKNLREADGWTTQASWLAAVGAYTGLSEMRSRPPV